MSLLMGGMDMRMGVFLMLLMCQVVSGQESWQLGGSDTTRHAEELRLRQEANAIQAQALMQQRAYMQQSLLLQQQQQQQAFQQRQQEAAPQRTTPTATERKVYVPGPTVYVPMGTPPEVLEKIKKLERELVTATSTLHMKIEEAWDATLRADKRKYFHDDMKKRLREVLENRGTKEEFLKILDEKMP
jgi:hypothetical protein